MKPFYATSFEQNTNYHVSNIPVGAAGVLVGHPFDTVKVHLQTQNQKNPLYSGTFNCFKSIIGKDSFAGLYRGISSPMGGVALVNAIIFGVYGNIQRRSSDPDSMQSHFLAGSAAGLAQSFVCSPMELIKTRLQLQSQNTKNKQFTGALHCLGHIFKTEGVRGVYRGIGITCLRDLPGFSSYFVSYEMLIRVNPNPGNFYLFMAGGIAGVISWILTVPMDVIKSRLQADGMGDKHRYTGIRDCLTQSYKEEGLAFLTRGMCSTLLRAFFINAACFFVVSWTLKLFDRRTVQVELPNDDHITISSGSPLQSLVIPIVVHRDDASHHYKANVMKSLVYAGALSDAMCSIDFVDLANDLCNDSNDNNYCNYNADRLMDFPSVTGTTGTSEIVLSE